MLARSDPFEGLPRGYFRVVCADPPWKFRTRSQRGVTSRAPEHHYGTMDLEQIVGLPVVELAAPDAHLFLWITGPMLVKGAHIPVMMKWGFEPTAIAFTWVKTRKHEDASLFLCGDSFHVGMGYTTRKNVEICILGRRGNPQRLRKDVRELIISPRREHSRKPDEFYNRVRDYAAGPYLDLFSREIRPAFTSWGNETTRFGGAHA